MGQGDAERDVWKDREMGKETGRQADTEGRALQEEDLRSLVSAPVGAGHRAGPGLQPSAAQGASSIPLRPIGSGLPHLRSHTPKDGDQSFLHLLPRPGTG